MSFDEKRLLEPLDPGNPCGPDLRSLSDSDWLIDLAGSEQPIDWTRHFERIVGVAERCRDLRAWTWLARAGLSVDGWPGLAAGLELIADGLERFWDVLPPCDFEESNPRERFMGRLTALSALGVSSSLFPPMDLTKRRDVYFLSQELDALVARTVPTAETDTAVARIEEAMERIEALVRSHFGDGSDPQLGFELIRSKIDALWTRRTVEEETRLPVPSLVQDTRAGDAPGTIGSREDVVRVLDLVIAYYRAHEPSSPVPLLVERAKKLVPMNYVEAMRELAPGGMKELAVVAGVADDSKGKKTGE